MVEFNELRITDDQQYLIIDVQINPDPFYDDVYIDSILIDDQDSFVSVDNPTGAVFTYNIEDTSVKSIRLELSETNINRSFNNTLLFIYTVTSGEPSEDAPCGTTDPIVMKTVIDLYPIYQSLMQNVKEVENSCEIPYNFVDKYLRFKAVQLAIATGNYPIAIKYWKMFFANMKPKQTICSCNGKIRYNRK